MNNIHIYKVAGCKLKSRCSDNEMKGTNVHGVLWLSSN